MRIHQVRVYSKRHGTNTQSPRSPESHRRRNNLARRDRAAMSLPSTSFGSPRAGSVLGLVLGRQASTRAGLAPSADTPFAVRVSGRE